METKNIEIDKIIPYTNNPRNNKKAIDKVASSIKEFGFKQPLVLDEENVVIVGHTRLEAAKKLGIKEVPCIIASDLTQAQIKAYRIADNKVGEMAEWDLEKLEIEFEALKEMDFDLELTGFDLEDIEIGEEKEVIEDDFDSEKELESIEEPISKRGDIWLLGKHRLMCGDSTSIEDVEKLMDGKKADMVFTDPPYLIQTQGGGALQKSFNKTAERIKDIVDFKPKDFLGILPIVFNNCMNTYIFCNKDLIPDYLNYAKDNKYNFNILTWCKKQVVPFTGGHHYSDIEYMIYLTKNPIFNNGLKDVTYRKYFVLDNEKSKDHPTIKPQEIICNEIKISSNKNGIVMDFFGGSGSTLISSEQTDRICYMMELDEKYSDVIVKRYINLKDSDEDVFLLREGKKIPYSELLE